jgi:hypothetical protein
VNLLEAPGTRAQFKLLERIVLVKDSMEMDPIGAFERGVCWSIASVQRSHLDAGPRP